MMIQLLSQGISFRKNHNSHRIPDPRLRIYLTLILIAAVIFTEPGNWSQFGALAVWLIFTVVKSGHSPVNYFSRLLRIYPMIFLMSFMFLFNRPLAENSGNPLVSIGMIEIYTDGLHAFLDLNLRSLLIVSSSYMLIYLVPFAHILQAFTKLKMPEWVESILIYMHRFTFLIDDEFSRIHMAYKSRAIQLSRIRKIKTILNISGIYLVRLIDRSERTHLSMISKGFSGKIPSLESISWERSDSINLLFNSATILTITILL